jgi:hypothetical protein
MTAAPNATRMTTRSIAREHELIAREAEDLAHMATRLAENPERGIAIGSAQQIAEAARRLELRALKAQIVGETAELFTADLEAKETT